VGLSAWRKSWAIASLAVGLALTLAGCETMFPKPVYTPPPTVAPPPPPRAQIPRATLYVAVNRLNLRACPGMDCPKITVLARNEEVEKIGEAGDWSQIRIKQNGTIGWVSTRYLSASVVSPPPEVATPTEVTPPPPPAQPEMVQPAPAVEKPKPARPSEVTMPTIKKKPEETRPAAAPAKAAKPAVQEVSSPRKPALVSEQPVKPAKPAKPAPAPPAEKPAPPTEKQAPPAGPAPEQPSSIRIM
jgi:SH3-like domain-containing protein